MDAGGKVDFGALSEELALMAASGLAGIYSNGTAGEFHCQSEDEFDRLSEMLAGAARAAGLPFQIGVSESNPRRALHRLRRIKALRPDAVQVTLPDWVAPSDTEAARFLEGMASEGVPLVLYNPGHAKRRLSLEEIAALAADCPALIGAKLGGGDAGWYEQRRRLVPDLSIFVPGHTLAFGRGLGADGSYSNIACLSPHGALLHWRLACTAPDEGKKLEARIMRFIGEHLLPLARARSLSDAALDKAMAAAGGWGPVGPRLLWPYEGASEHDVAVLARAARDILPEFFENE